MAREYAGDGVFVEVLPDGTVVLVTSNGLTDTNRVVLEPEVWESTLSIVANQGGATRGKVRA